MVLPTTPILVTAATSILVLTLYCSYYLVDGKEKIRIIIHHFNSIYIIASSLQESVTNAQRANINLDGREFCRQLDLDVFKNSSTQKYYGFLTRHNK